MPKKYIGTQVISAWCMSRGHNNVPGYCAEFANRHIIWIPKDEFDKIYTPVGTTDVPFSMALDALLKGKSVSRAAWEDGWHVYQAEYDGELYERKALSALRLVYRASLEDMLATDWRIV